jgi:transcriptional regulator with XRE-family HTH domain
MEINRQALGAFLRAHRERLAPTPDSGSRRRTPGLRREEIAVAADLSATWYTWLEQGRNLSASPSALVRIANALRLNAAERAYLFDLAGRRDPDAPPPAEGSTAELLALPQHMDIPAYVMDACWNALAWNSEAERLFVGWLDAYHDRNLLRYVFLSDEARRLIDGWVARSQRVVAEFRADFSRASFNNPQIITLIDDLSKQSNDFRCLWDAQSVLTREGGERLFNHPTDGPRRYIQTTLVVPWDPGLKLVTLSPE